MSDHEFYRPGKSIQEFHDSTAFIRCLVGGRGSGKTSGVVIENTRHCWLNAGAKCLFLRKTEISQADSTIESMMQIFSELDPDLYSETDDSLFKTWNNGRTIRLPSEQAVRRYHLAKKTLRTKAERNAWLDTEGAKWCGFIEFRGLPHATVSQSKLRGFECSMLNLIEADQMEKSDFTLSLACLRWKGADPETCDENGFIRETGVILDTNPPAPTHWIAKMDADEAAKPKHDREMEFWHIPTHENEHNLPPEYIKRQILLPYANNPAMIERMLYGRYAEAFEGNAVFYAYNREAHEGSDLGWPKGASLIASMDVGTNNASVISAFKNRGRYWHWWVLREIILTGSDTERQSLELLKVLANEFPWWNSGSALCPDTLFFCDPAARNSAFTDSQSKLASALAVFHSHGIFPGMKLAQRIQPTIALMNRMLQQSYILETPAGPKTIWQFQIDIERCPTLASAFRGEYRYPTKDEVGYGNDQPLKGSLCNHVDHPVDALRYGAINCLNIDMESHIPEMTSRHEEPANPEPARSI